MHDQFLDELMKTAGEVESDRPIGGTQTIKKATLFHSTGDNLLQQNEETHFVDGTPVTITTESISVLRCGCSIRLDEDFAGLDKYNDTVCKKHLKFCSRCNEPVAFHNSKKIRGKWICKSHVKIEFVILVIKSLWTLILAILHAFTGKDNEREDPRTLQPLYRGRNEPRSEDAEIVDEPSPQVEREPSITSENKADKHITKRKPRR